jgi:zinc and cadmium transporter
MGAQTQALLATLWVSLSSFLGSVRVLRRRPGARGDAMLLSFAAGVLLATSFLELAPEAVEKSHGHGNVFIATLVAMIVFFFLERVLHGFHVHEDEHGHPRGPHSSRYLILVGDALHNFIDGVVIAASFAVSTELGVLTTVAVNVHEVPHEFADFGILTAGGFSVRTALMANFASGLMAVFGAFAFFSIAPGLGGHVGWLLATTAGMFIYVAGSDLIPQLHHHDGLRGSWVYAPFLGGVLVIAGLGAMLGH